MTAFRDHLRANADDRRRYEAVKRELARRTWRHVQDYADAKGDIVQEIHRAIARGGKPSGPGADRRRSERPILGRGGKEWRGRPVRQPGTPCRDLAVLGLLAFTPGGPRSSASHRPSRRQSRAGAVRVGRGPDPAVRRSLDTNRAAHVITRPAWPSFRSGRGQQCSRRPPQGPRAHGYSTTRRGATWNAPRSALGDG
ncbi:GrpB family protein [Actinoalloteichus caeruleus]|uniref:GrpB family protein n=1 Tax=Actinoalloteichus cyanogriseus TaxID=2893586 RepID=UPI00200EEDF4|nr:GrpB family protein [Actinoalloteichus caeruleus]